jgi:hypothetical protein
VLAVIGYHACRFAVRTGTNWSDSFHSSASLSAADHCLWLAPRPGNHCVVGLKPDVRNDSSFGVNVPVHVPVPEVNVVALAVRM